MTEKKKQLAELFATKPTKCELEEPDPILAYFTVIIHFGDVAVKGRIREGGCCMGKTLKWSLDCKISENGGKDYTAYRSYPLTQALQANKEIPLSDLVGVKCNF